MDNLPEELAFLPLFAGLTKEIRSPCYKIRESFIKE